MASKTPKGFNRWEQGARAVLKQSRALDARRQALRAAHGIAPSNRLERRARAAIEKKARRGDITVERKPNP